LSYARAPARELGRGPILVNAARNFKRSGAFG
jgi:hypothetical protein